MLVIWFPDCIPVMEHREVVGSTKIFLSLQFAFSVLVVVFAVIQCRNEVP